MPDLERDLRALAGMLDAPAMAGLPQRVAAGIRETAPVRLGSVLRSPWRVRRVVVLAAATLVLAAGTAVALRYWVRGVEVRRVPTPPSASPQRVGQDLDLGRPVSLFEARGTAPFPLTVPALLGPPDQVWLREDLPVTQVIFVYRTRPGLPPASTTGVGLLLTQFQARVDQTLVVKEAGPGTTVETLEVDGGPGFWIEGRPHAVLYEAPGGRPFGDQVRLAGNVLLWQHGEVSLRLEADVSRARALAIAGST